VGRKRGRGREVKEGEGKGEGMWRGPKSGLPQGPQWHSAGLVACHVHPLPGDVMLTVDVTEIMPFTVHVTLSPCCRERRQEFIPPEMWPPNSPDLNPVDYSIWGILQERVYRLQIHDVKELKERLLREWRLLDHTIITAAIAQWRSRLNACVRVNGGHFEHKF